MQCLHTRIHPHTYTQTHNVVYANTRTRFIIDPPPGAGDQGAQGGGHQVGAHQPQCRHSADGVAKEPCKNQKSRAKLKEPCQRALLTNWRGCAAGQGPCRQGLLLARYPGLRHPGAQGGKTRWHLPRVGRAGNFPASAQ